jgi:hypothetical protein
MCPPAGDSPNTGIGVDSSSGNAAAPESASGSVLDTVSRFSAPALVSVGSFVAASSPLPSTVSPNLSQTDPHAGGGQDPISPGSVPASPLRSAAAGPSPTVPAASTVLPHPSTRLQHGIHKPKIYTDGTVRWGMSAACVAGEPNIGS